MKKQKSLILGVFYGISTVLVLIGVFFKIMHYNNAQLIFQIGLVLGILTIVYDINRLKKKNKQLEEQLNQK